MCAFHQWMMILTEVEIGKIVFLSCRSSTFCADDLVINRSIALSLKHMEMLCLLLIGSMAMVKCLRVTIESTII